MTNPLTSSIVFLSVAVAVASAEAPDGKSRVQLMSAALEKADQLIVEPVPPMFDRKAIVEKHEIAGREKIAKLVAGLEFDEKRSGQVCAFLRVHAAWTLGRATCLWGDYRRSRYWQEPAQLSACLRYV